MYYKIIIIISLKSKLDYLRIYQYLTQLFLTTKPTAEIEHELKALEEGGKIFVVQHRISHEAEEIWSSVQMLVVPNVQMRKKPPKPKSSGPYI